MKKLKLFLLLFAAAVTSVGFTACSDDEDDAAASIVGSWLYQDEDEIDILTFTPEGEWVEQYQNLLDENRKYTDSGTYTYDGSILILDGDEYVSVIISGDTMIFDEDEIFVRI